jgi:hypothetical protein
VSYTKVLLDAEEEIHSLLPIVIVTKARDVVQKKSEKNGKITT